MNAGRKYLSSNDLTGKVFLTSGLGGMSGAQAKASVIANCIGVIAEVCTVGSHRVNISLAKTNEMLTPICASLSVSCIKS